MDNLARTYTTDGKTINITISQPQANRNLSRYTSQGKPKAQEAEPITSLEHIRQIQEYFLNQAPPLSYRNHALFTIGIALGLRISDIGRVRLCDFIHPDGSYRKRLVITEKKTGKTNYPEISKVVRDTLDYYKANVDLDYNDYLFFSRKGGKLDRSSLFRILKSAQKDLKLPYNIGTHTLRKTFAYWTIQNNRDNPIALMALQKMLNHSDQRVTFRYAGILQEEVDSLYEGLSDVFGNIPNDNLN